MIVLDTNILSELMRVAPAPEPLTWLALQGRHTVFTTAISEAEMLYGARALPEGRRRRDLEQLVLQIFREDFPGRVLPFDSDAADRYATIVNARRAMGRPIREFDAQIAAIALSRDASIATRNTRDFEEIGLEIVNPWVA
jgi:toxin FitB